MDAQKSRNMIFQGFSIIENSGKVCFRSKNTLYRIFQLLKILEKSRFLIFKRPYFISADEFMVSRHRFGSKEPGSGLKSKYLLVGDT